MKASNGLRHARQKWVERHSVGPNALSSSVSALPQNGHVAGVAPAPPAPPAPRGPPPSVARGTNTGPGRSPGGVRPYVRRARRPSGDIRSLVHVVLRHRVLVNYRAEAEGMSVEKIIDQLVQAIEEPK